MGLDITGAAPIKSAAVIRLQTIEVPKLLTRYSRRTTDLDLHFLVFITRISSKSCFLNTYRCKESIIVAGLKKGTQVHAGPSNLAPLCIFHVSSTKLAI